MKSEIEEIAYKKVNVRDATPSGKLHYLKPMFLRMR